MRAFVLGLCLAAPAAGQATPLRWFGGEFSEMFATQVSAGQAGSTPCLVGRAFDDTADVCTPGASGIQLRQGWADDCTINAYAPGWFLGPASGSSVEFTFDAPVARFGGFFNNNTATTNLVTVTFYDAADNRIDAPQFLDPNDCVWTWKGWQLAPPARRITVENAGYGGARVAMDALQASLVPATWLGSNYCAPAHPNSTGYPGRIYAVGSPLADDGDLRLRADQLPPNQFGFFLCSRVSGFLPNVGGSVGDLCLGHPIGRLVIGGSQISPLGYLADTVNTGNMPNQLPAQILAGDTWYFQAWHRDNAAGPGASNLTSGLSIAFR